jgi:hypothetical protein
MNKTKFKKYLKKIKPFEDWIDSDEQLSTIENDLLLDYIKKMYEAVLDKEDEHKTNKIKKKHKQEESVTEQIIKEEKEEKEEKIKDEPEVQTVSDNKTVVAEETIEEEKKEEKELKIDYSDEFLSIFVDNNSNELSEKLSKRPIKDLKKAFGINEKIFTVKEIFNGDKNAFEQAISKFNELNDFEEAKQYILNELAPAYYWDSPKNIKKIGQFIKTIQRRYIK